MFAPARYQFYHQAISRWVILTISNEIFDFIQGYRLIFDLCYCLNWGHFTPWRPEWSCAALLPVG